MRLRTIVVLLALSASSTLVDAQTGTGQGTPNASYPSTPPSPEQGAPTPSDSKTSPVMDPANSPDSTATRPEPTADDTAMENPEKAAKKTKKTKH